MSNYSSFLQLKKDLKHAEMRLIERQSKILREEIVLREKQIKENFKQYAKLQDEAQGIADQLLGLEYEACKKYNL